MLAFRRPRRKFEITLSYHPWGDCLQHTSSNSTGLCCPRTQKRHPHLNLLLLLIRNTRGLRCVCAVIPPVLDEHIVFHLYQRINKHEVSRTDTFLPFLFFAQTTRSSSSRSKSPRTDWSGGGCKMAGGSCGQPGKRCPCWSRRKRTERRSKKPEIERQEVIDRVVDFVKQACSFFLPPRLLFVPLVELGRDQVRLRIHQDFCGAF